MKLLTLSLALAIPVFTSSASHAAHYCITAETALVSALTNATSSAEDDDIRFVSGLLNIDVNLTHCEHAAPLTYFPGQPQA